MLFNAPKLLLLGLISSVSAQAASNCSVKGYDNGKHLAYYVDKNITTPAACKAFCLSSTVAKCSSFAVGGGCLLYNVPVNGNVVAMNTSTFTFWDEACTV
ncbi:hypothetical protein EG329_013280 [Mollisiaceae sp. DMI_Dod_QoI]|nr:hypothetical protein EG329_013280 [Helotiales sp. DMI_Dod_QoI]